MSEQFKTQLRPDVERVLKRLRKKIRLYLLLEGLASVIALLAVFFWFSLVLDWGYFRASNLELPRWFRATFDILSLCTITAAFMAWVALRFFRAFRIKALALVLEKRFPELDNRLLTAVELGSSISGNESELTISMLNRTVGDVSRMAGRLDLEQVFERKPLHRSLMMAVVLTVSIFAFAMINQTAMARWADGFIGLKEEYWQRETQLSVRIIAQPGDRILEFKDNVYKHPRGADLTILVDVPAGKKVPQRVQMQYRLANGKGSERVYPLGDRQFKHSLVGLLDNMRFWIQGGDFINRHPFEVLVVDPPGTDQISLDCIYPDYAGLNEIDEETGDPLPEQRVVQGTQISLPLETQFMMNVTANKPLVRVFLQTDHFDLEFGKNLGNLVAQTDLGSEGLSSESIEVQSQAVLTTKSDDGEVLRRIPLSSQIVTRFLDSGKPFFRVPLTVTSRSEILLSDIDGSWDGMTPLPLPADSMLRIYLEDEDKIVSLEPTRISINGIVDQPPVIETSLKGIGHSITTKATIPVEGTITDDYGIVKSRFDFHLGTDQGFRPRPFRNGPKNRTREFQLLRSRGEEPVEQYELFKVQPLELEVGQELTLTVFAEDADNINGPNNGRGESYKFKIVSSNELLSLLYSRELNLRRRFEQIISEVLQIQKDLIQQQIRLGETNPFVENSSKAGLSDDDKRELNDLKLSLVASAERGLHAIRKSATETASIEESFRDIREELVNNVVATPPMLKRIDESIVLPLGEINSQNFPTVDESLGLFKLANDQSRDPSSKIAQSVSEIETLLARMQIVLDEMQDLLEYHEAVEFLRNIIDLEKSLIEKTKAERKRKLLEGLKRPN